MTTPLRWQLCHFRDFDTASLYAAMSLRQAVFVVEQNCPYLDMDYLDQHAVHMLCWRGDELLATQRCLPPGAGFPEAAADNLEGNFEDHLEDRAAKAFNESALGRIVVAKAARGGQLGRELVRRGIEYNLHTWPDSDIRIGAQSHLQAFYASLGFIATGKEYLEDGIPHIHMLYRRPVSQATETR